MVNALYFPWSYIKVFLFWSSTFPATWGRNIMASSYTGALHSHYISVLLAKIIGKRHTLCTVLFFTIGVNAAMLMEYTLYPVWKLVIRRPASCKCKMFLYIVGEKRQVGLKIGGQNICHWGPLPSVQSPPFHSPNPSCQLTSCCKISRSCCHVPLIICDSSRQWPSVCYAIKCLAQPDVPSPGCLNLCHQLWWHRSE